MHENYVLENIFGTIGTVLWSGQMIPQIYKSWRTKSTEGLSPYMIIIWALSAYFYGVYAIVQNINIPLIVQPQAFGALTSIVWAQCLYYGAKKSRWYCFWAFSSYSALAVGFQVGFVYALRAALRKQLPGAEKGLQFFGLFGAALIAVGLLPQYFEVYRFREVKGISFTFLLVDIFGGVFSLLSLGFKAKWDTVASITYILVVVMDGIIIVAALVLNPMARRRRRMAEEAAGDAEKSTNGVEPVVERQEKALNEVGSSSQTAREGEAPDTGVEAGPSSSSNESAIV